MANDVWLSVTVAGAAAPILVRLGTVTDRLVITGLIVGAVGPQEVGVRSLRRLPLRELKEGIGRLIEVAPEALLSDLDAEGRERAKTFLDRLRDAVKVEVARGWTGPRKLTDGRLKAVADAYRDRVAKGDRQPVKSLQMQFPTEDGGETPAPSIRRWLQLARRRGLLGPAAVGKAGERPEGVS